MEVPERPATLKIMVTLTGIEAIKFRRYAEMEFKKNGHLAREILHEWLSRR